jgi:hypothetical protein
VNTRMLLAEMSNADDCSAKCHSLLLLDFVLG